MGVRVRTVLRSTGEHRPGPSETGHTHILEGMSERRKPRVGWTERGVKCVPISRKDSVPGRERQGGIQSVPGPTSPMGRQLQELA